MSVSYYGALSLHQVSPFSSFLDGVEDFQERTYLTEYHERYYLV